MNVHANGTFFTGREVFERWISENQAGTILNMGSVLARFPERRFFATHAYHASKGAFAGAGYYAPRGIRRNLIVPSLVRTPMSVRPQSNPAIVEFMKQKQPLKGELIEADEVARIACFLLSDESFPITPRDRASGCRLGGHRMRAEEI